MSYSVLLFRKEVKDQNKGFEFLEDDSRIPSFTDEQFEKLKKWLLSYHFEMESETPDAIEYNFKGGLYGISVTLYRNQVSFRSGFNEHGIFEISQTASELASLGDFAKLDMQEGKWEESF